MMADGTFYQIKRSRVNWHFKKKSILNRTTRCKTSLFDGPPAVSCIIIVYTRELHGDKNSSPFQPRTQYFVPITAGFTAVINANFWTAVPITTATAVKARTRSHYRGFYRGNPAVTAVGNTMQVSSIYPKIML